MRTLVCVVCSAEFEFDGQRTPAQKCRRCRWYSIEGGRRLRRISATYQRALARRRAR